MIFTALTLLVGGLAVLVLGWCFTGFYSAMKEPPNFLGVLINPRNILSKLKQRGKVLEFPSPTQAAPDFEQKEPRPKIRASR